MVDSGYQEHHGCAGNLVCDELDLVPGFHFCCKVPSREFLVSELESVNGLNFYLENGS